MAPILPVTVSQGTSVRFLKRRGAPAIVCTKSSKQFGTEAYGFMHVLGASKLGFLSQARKRATCGPRGSDVVWMLIHRFAPLLTDVRLEQGDPEGLVPLYLLWDGHRAHGTKAVRAWLKDHNIRVVDWPPRSSDLNMIEQCWGVLNRHVSPYGHKSRAAFQQAMQDAWSEHVVKDCASYCRAMTGRCKQVLANAGGSSEV